MKKSYTVKAVFFDRDGVLNRALKSAGKPLAPLKFKDFKLYKNLEKYISKLKYKSFLTFVVTNQPDFFRKNKKELVLMHKKLLSKMDVDRIFICYQKSDLSCNKKPNVGLVRKIIKEKKINLNQSFVIGDRWRDVDFAFNLNCKSIFIDRNYKEKLKKKPNYTCYSTIEAIKKILSESN